MSDGRASDICDLSANENPSAPSPRVLAAIAAAAQRLNRYPDREDEELREAVANALGRGLTPEHVLTGASGSEVLELIARVHLDHGDEAIICPPTFTVYAPQIQRLRATVIKVPLDPRTFACDVDAVLDAVTARTRIVYVCNPGNPTGVIIPSSAVERLLDRLPANVLVLADEVYFQYVTSARYPDSIGHVLSGRSMIVVHSFSKAYALAGLRLGYAIAAPPVTHRIAAARRKFHLGRLEVAAGVAALSDTAFVGDSVALVHRELPSFYAAFDRLRLTYWRSDANFVLFRAPGDAAALQQALLEKGVRIRTTNGNGLPGHLRVTVGLPAENRRFLFALDEVVSCA
jgi:histidinol-phosphate aminotransferase